MSKALKIKILLVGTQIKNKVVRQLLGGMSSQSWTNKRKRDSFTADDLIVLSQATGTTLAFIHPQTHLPIVTFDIEDLTPRVREIFERSCLERNEEAESHLISHKKQISSNERD